MSTEPIHELPLRQYSDEQLATSLALMRQQRPALQAKLHELQAAINQADRHIEEVCREQERRNASRGAEVHWGVLLQNSFRDSIAASGTLAEALKPFDLFPGREYWDDTGQQVVCMRLRHNDPEQIKRITQGVKLLLPHIEPLKRGDRVIRLEIPNMRRGHRCELAFDREDAVRFEDSNASGPIPFPNLRAALKALQKTHGWTPAAP